MAERVAPPSSRELTTIGYTTIRLATGDDPWAIPADTLVVPCSRRGALGSRGLAFRQALLAYGVTVDILGELAAKVVGQATALRDVITPEQPYFARPVDRESELRQAGIEIRELCLATAQGGAGSPPPEVETATRAVLSEAQVRGVGHLVLPVIGIGNDRVEPGEAARATAAALDHFNRPFPGEPLQVVTLLLPGEELVPVFVEAVTRAGALASSTTSGVPESGVEAGPERRPADELTVQLRMLSDAPIGDDRLDLLGYKDYADALAYLIQHPDAGTPLTIAINAVWGAGKTSLAKMTEAQIRGFETVSTGPPIVAWFNAWHHDDAPNIGIPLAATVARTVAAARPWWRRVVDPIPYRLRARRKRRRSWLVTGIVSVGAAAIALVLAQALGAPSGAQFGVTGAAALAFLVIPMAATIRGTASDVAGLLRSPEETAVSGSIVAVRQDLGTLIHQATRVRRRPRRRLVVFIDDIERCQPPRSIEVCEAINQLLSHEDVVIVLLGDMHVIATSAEAKYHELVTAGTRGEQTSFGERYLEKVVQFRFDLPVNDNASLERFAASVTRQAAAPGTRESVDRGQGIGPEREAAPPDPRLAPSEERRRDVSARLDSRADVPPRNRFSLRAWRAARQARGRARREADAVASLLQRSDLQDLVRSSDDEDLRRKLRDTSHLEVPPPVRLAALRRAEIVALLDAPESLDACFAGAARHVRPLPRDVKRLLNRIRFLLYLAETRNLVGPDGPLTSERLGKWALLSDRWPELAVAVAANPHLLEQLEPADSPSNRASYESLVKSNVPAYAGDTELERLISGQPRLAPVAKVLVELSPSAPTRDGEAGARTQPDAGSVSPKRAASSLQ